MRRAHPLVVATDLGRPRSSGRQVPDDLQRQQGRDGAGHHMEAVLIPADDLRVDSVGPWGRLALDQRRIVQGDILLQGGNGPIQVLHLRQR